MSKRRISLIFHHTDNDGFGSAKVCLDRCRNMGYDDNDIICIAVTLNGRQIDFIEQQIRSYNTDNDQRWLTTEYEIGHIFIVDLSIPSAVDIIRIGEVIREVNIDTVITWIDHHITSVDAVTELSKGIEYNGTYYDKPLFQNFTLDTSCSAAKLAWLTLFNNNVPQVLELISDHDIFAHRLEGSLEFFNGSGIYNLRDIKSTFWDGLIADGPVWGEHIDMVVSSGDVIGQYMTESLYPMIFAQRIEFKLSICAPHKVFTFDNCVAVNSIVGNSAIFGDCGEGYKSYDICVKYYQNKDGNYTYTLYSDKYDISHICKHLGGGGHPGAAGFTIGHNMFELPDSDERSHNLRLYSADGKLLEKYLPDTSIRECPLA